ncbi:Uncharacterised protein [Bordetella pertussis]|nr:Uncharacterised protein [Bordetella pertussis]CFU90163.1 Uncharacterised protein [Bordetella pertussis]CPI60240.1 Uncharacterised protein [Bordetella pertussis]CPM36578.1 Uncharacterised protein [Bordetella pertussis]CPO02544.1 Uncharacterised protein [Bordetella pertussis]
MWCSRSGRSPCMVASLTCMSRQKVQPLICEARMSTRSRIDVSMLDCFKARLKATNFLNNSGDCCW